ncbi:unnamed protein product [Musa textilis]
MWTFNGLLYFETHMLSTARWTNYSLLPYLPLRFSSIHLRGVSALFLAWLALFKLLLLAFAAGLLSLSLPFFASSVLPVKQLDPHHHKTKSPSIFPPPPFRGQGLPPGRPYPHPFLLLSLSCIHMYLALELVLAGVAAVAALLLPRGFELEPHFDAPRQAVSLQDFWDRRWNLLVSAILRPSVYLPMHPLRPQRRRPRGLPGLRPHARGHVLVRHPRAAHRGGDGLLRAPRGVRGGRRGLAAGRMEAAAG